MAGLTVTAMLALNAGAAAAQSHALDRGAMRIGGSASVTSTSYDTDGTSSDRVTNIALSPMVEYFVAPGLALGGSVSVQRASFEETSQTSWSIGPSAAYYFHAPERQLHPYLAAGVGFGQSRLNTTNERYTANQTSYRGAGGVLLLLAPNVGATGELFYNHVRQSNDDVTAKANTFGFAAGISVYLF